MQAAFGRAQIMVTAALQAGTETVYTVTLTYCQVNMKAVIFRGAKVMWNLMIHRQNELTLMPQTPLVWTMQSVSEQEVVGEERG